MHRITTIIDFAQEQEVFAAHGLSRDGGNLPGVREPGMREVVGHAGELADDRRREVEADLIRHVMETTP